MKPFISLWLLIAASLPHAIAQRATAITVPNIDSLQIEHRGQFRIDIAQDWFVNWWPGLNFDRNYTQGTSCTYAKHDLHETIFFLPLNKVLRFSEEYLYADKDNWIDLPSKISLGVTAFTPLVIDSISPVIGDRPFSNVVFFSTERNYYRPSKKMHVRLSFNYGIIGSNVANSFQSFAHKRLIPGRPTDISWEHQISNGGKFAFLFSRQATRQFFDKKIGKKQSMGLMKDQKDVTTNLKMATDSLLNKPSWRAGASLSFDMNLGWYNSVGSTLSFQLGKYAPNDLIDLFSPLDNGEMMIPFNETVSIPRRQYSYFMFASVTPRITPYNALILGQKGSNDVYTLPSSDYNPLLLDIQYGISFSCQKFKMLEGNKLRTSKMTLSLSIRHRSSEIRNATYKRWHHWGEAALAFPLF
ncbi:MAG: DUF2219 family protein [Saprospiraceae bacterium]|nr:DUF2219 family protein [Saprospiraceae bacterium]